MKKTRLDKIFVLGDEEKVEVRRIYSASWGKYHSGGRGIQIDDEISPQEFSRTVLHEYFHAFLYRTVDPDATVNQETVCRLFETALVDLVRNNWEWLEHMAEEVDV